jgi:hypothetical protein
MFEFGVSDPEIVKKLLPSLPKLGMADKALTLQEKFASPELQADLQLMIADQAVIRPESVPAAMTELSNGASVIRSALDALDAGDEPRTLELLQGIPRSSPLADWRLFVRGLAAFRRNDMGQARANWDRLDGKRAANRIATKLLAVVETDNAPNLTALESRQFGEPVIERLDQLQQAIDTGKWERALNLIGPLRRTLARVDVEWAQRLTAIVLGPLRKEICRHSLSRAKQLLRSFTSVLEPLPFDPKWNRFQAILWETPQGDVREAIPLWEAYAADLQAVPTVLGVNSKQAQALVWQRIGDMAASQIDESDDDFWDDDFEDFDDPDAPLVLKDDLEAKTNAKIEKAADAFERSLKLDPKQRQTYEKLVELYLENDRTEQASQTMQRLAEAFPDDVGILKQMVQHHILKDDPLAVFEYVKRIRKLKPLDPTLQAHEIWAHLAQARLLAVKHKFDDGRKHFQILEASFPESASTYRHFVRKAAFEFKAGQNEQAELFVQESEKLQSEPGPLWLNLAAETARYNAPKPVIKRFNDLFNQTVKKKVSAPAAGAMAALLLSYLTFNIKYVFRSKHISAVADYIRRTIRLQYEKEDHLKAVVRFLKSIKKERALAEKFTQIGLKSFPRSPYFLLAGAKAAMANGPIYLGVGHIRDLLDTALKEAEAREPELIQEIKAAQSELLDLEEMLNASPFRSRSSDSQQSSSNPGMNAFQEMVEMMANEMRAKGIDMDDMPFDMFLPSPGGKGKK